MATAENAHFFRSSARAENLKFFSLWATAQSLGLHLSLCVLMCAVMDRHKDPRIDEYLLTYFYSIRDSIYSPILSF